MQIDVLQEIIHKCPTAVTKVKWDGQAGQQTTGLLADLTFGTVLGCSPYAMTPAAPNAFSCSCICLLSCCHLRKKPKGLLPLLLLAPASPGVEDAFVWVQCVCLC